MSIALRSAVPVSSSSSRLRVITGRVHAVPTVHVGAIALAVLIGGLLLSIATTSDPLWWQLHFSQLGTFHDLSAAFFNNTLKVTGAIVVYFAFRVHRDVRRLARGSVRRGAATVAFLCLNVVGVNLALVGCIPLNTDKDLHDRVAGSMVLGFLALLLSAPVMFHRLGRRMVISTGIALLWLVVSIALFVTATINLALFETVACAAMFAWSGMFTHILASGATAGAERADAATPHGVHVSPRRRARRPLAVGRARAAATRGASRRTTARPASLRTEASSLTATPDETRPTVPVLFTTPPRGVRGAGDPGSARLTSVQAGRDETSAAIGHATDRPSRPATAAWAAATATASTTTTATRPSSTRPSPARPLMPEA